MYLQVRGLIIDYVSMLSLSIPGKKQRVDEEEYRNV